MRALLALLMILPLHKLLAQDVYQSLAFNSDSRSIILPLPKGRSCSFLLDDDSNYEIAKLDAVTLQVSSKAITERSALLIVDCAPETWAYRLSFSNRERYNPEEALYRAGIDRMNSSVAVGQEQGKTIPSSRFVEVADYSFAPLTLAVRRSSSSKAKGAEETDSIDLSHSFDDYSLGYGLSKFRSAHLSRDLYRLNASAHGYALNSRIEHENENPRYQRYALFIPPLGTRLSYQEDRRGQIERSMEKHILWGTGAFSHHSSVSFQGVTFPKHESNFQRLAGNESLLYNGLPWIKPGGDIGGSCVDTCLVNLLSLKSEYRDSRRFVTATYGLIPHHYSLDARMKFQGRQELGLGLSRQMPALLSQEELSWVQADEFVAPFQARGSLHLEYTKDDLHFSADHQVPIYDSRGERTIYGRFNAQYDTERTHSSLSFSMPYKEPGSHWILAFEIRYYFMPNIRTASLSLPLHSIKGRVTSNFGDRPIGGASVQLFSADTEIAQTVTDESGSFLLKDVPTAGTYRILAKKGQQEVSASVDKKLENRDMLVDLKMPDRVAVHVRFVEDTEAGPRPLPQSNFVKEIGEAIVHAPDAAYEAHTIWLPKAGKVHFEIAAELLPFDWELKAVEGQDLDLTSGDELSVIVHLTRRNP